MKPIIAAISILLACLAVTSALGQAISNDASLWQSRPATDVNGPHKSATSALDVRPTATSGPDLLQGYEDGMRAISATFINDLGVISRAVTERQITTQLAKQVTEERYLAAMMQFELLSALHTQVQQELEREAMSQNDLSSIRQDLIAVVQLPFSSFRLNPALIRYLDLSPSQVGAIQQILSEEHLKQQPMLEDLRMTGLRLKWVSQKTHKKDKALNTLTTSQGFVISKLIAANSRMQARIDQILSADQRGRIGQLQRMEDVNTINPQ